MNKLVNYGLKGREYSYGQCCIVWHHMGFWACDLDDETFGSADTLEEAVEVCEQFLKIGEDDSNYRSVHHN